MELYLIRHGKTVWNEKGLLQGHTDTELTEDGKEKAKELGIKMQNIHFDKVFSSPLKRAYETACFITQNKVQIEKDSRLIELCFGEQEGKDFTQWQKDSSPYKAFFTNPENYIPPKNGETLTQLIERTTDFVKSEIEPLYPTAKKVLVVAHGALNAGLMCYLQNSPIKNYWKNGLQNNLEATIFEYDGKIWRKKN